MFHTIVAIRSSGAGGGGAPLPVGQALVHNTGRYEVVSGGSLIRESFTYECWFKRTTNTWDFMNVMSRRTLVSGNTMIALGLRFSGNVAVRWTRDDDGSPGGSTTTFNTEVPFGVSNGVWYHVAVTRDFDSGVTSFYKNGVFLESQVVDAGGLIDSPELSTQTGDDAPFQFGRFLPDTNNYLTGAMAEARVWSIERTATEIADNMSQTLTGSEPGLEAYYRFDANLLDSGPNAHHGEIVESPDPTYESNPF